MFNVKISDKLKKYLYLNCEFEPFIDLSKYIFLQIDCGMYIFSNKHSSVIYTRVGFTNLFVENNLFLQN